MIRQFAALLIAFAAAVSAAPGAELKIAITSGTSHIWETLGTGGDYTPAQAESDLAAKLKDLSAPSGSVLLDLGYFTPYETASESAYDSPRFAFFTENGYDAVNVTAKDYLLGLSHRSGFKIRPAEMNDFFISSLDNTNSIPEALPSWTTVEKNGTELRVANLTDATMISAVPGAVSESVAKAPEETLRQALEGSKGPVVAFSDFDRARNIRLAQEHPGLAAIFETVQSDQPEETAGTTRIVPRAPGNEIRTVAIDGTVKSVGSEPWTSPEKYASLLEVGLPTIGMSVPGKGRVAEVLGVDGQNVLLDVHRDQAFSDLTPRTNIYAYNMIIDGARYRVYRVHHLVGSFRVPQDALVVLTEDHLIRRIETNLSAWPLRGYNTRLGEALLSVINKPPDQWSIQPETTRGLEDEAQRILGNLLLTIEVDKRLYPAASGD